MCVRVYQHQQHPAASHDKKSHHNTVRYVKQASKQTNKDGSRLHRGDGNGDSDGDAGLVLYDIFSQDDNNMAGNLFLFVCREEIELDDGTTGTAAG